MMSYGGLPPIFGEVGVSVVSWYSVDGDEIGEIRLRIELDEDLEREMYGLGGGLGVVSIVGKVAMVGELGDRSSPITGTSPKPGVTSMPNSSVKGRGGGRSTIASRSFDKTGTVRFDFLTFL
jgi:hypothetical protein